MEKLFRNEYYRIMENIHPWCILEIVLKSGEVRLTKQLGTVDYVLIIEI